MSEPRTHRGGEREMERLYKIESAAIKFLATMSRRHSRRYGRSVPAGFTMASSDAAIELDATLQQEYDHA